MLDHICASAYDNNLSTPTENDSMREGVILIMTAHFKNRNE